MLLLVIGFLCVVSAPFACCLDTWDEFAMVVEKVPQEEKYDFLQEHFFLGYHLRYNPHSECQKSKDYCDTALSLILLLEKDPYQSVEREKENFEKRHQVCFPNIGCIDPSDPGVRP
ncbi:uncharacterized protein LOC126735384 [Anthonomus grandis grandis]|uniref:uncharacterized protein LOC126735384 n=1 Tax=Anthonomus grandis grandis TaxID=2921223 RepID=UPI0021668FE9|nr:uncharacterized protein LOC126735384 [Anthonomus grandis grandis]